jgi:CDP-diacylglycerol---glycerol-3-phosphate 3-phosphatidyltransferase
VISERIGNLVRGQILGLGRFLAGLGLTPNMLTVIGVLLNGVVAVIIATDHPRLGGALLLVASAFDMLDGAVARASGSTSPFGGFLDSTLDRYSESLVFFGVLIYFLEGDDWKTGAILTFVSTVGALMISYARARAESLGYKASVGLLARPERVILLALFLMIGRPLIAMWILAFATHLTALTRIVHVWRISEGEMKTAARAESGSP